MTEIKTWADFAALSEDDRAAYTPEELDALKTSITEHEATVLQEREAERKKLQDAYEAQKIRAEKAEAAAKHKEPQEKPLTLSPKDAILLTRENLTEEEDIDEVIQFAGYKKVSIAEALKDKMLRSILSDRAEERKTAQAAQSKGGTPGTKVSDDALLDKLSKGEVPAKGSEEAERLFWARRGRKEQ